MLAVLLLIVVKVANSQALAVVEEVDNSIVWPVNWKRFEKRVPNDELANTVRATLLNVNKFSLGAWYHELKKYQADSTG